MIFFDSTQLSSRPLAWKRTSPPSLEPTGKPPLRHGTCSTAAGSARKQEGFVYHRPMDCPFCHVPEEERLFENDLVIAFYDRFPASPGHILLIPRRHVPTWFEATDAERVALTRAVTGAVAVIEARPGPTPDGYNVGFNSGEAAGQTVMHLHLHVIPRFSGDVPNPRGGVRGAVPHKRVYRLDET